MCQCFVERCQEEGGCLPSFLFVGTCLAAAGWTSINAHRQPADKQTNTQGMNRDTIGLIHWVTRLHLLIEYQQHGIERSFVFNMVMPLLSRLNLFGKGPLPSFFNLLSGSSTIRLVRLPTNSLSFLSFFLFTES